MVRAAWSPDEAAVVSAVDGPVCEVGAEADQVDRSGGQVVFELDFLHATVPGFAQAERVGCLVHGAFDAGATLVVGAPIHGALGGECGVLDLV